MRITKIKHLFTRNYMRIYGKFHRIEKKILFSSFGGKQYSDNPRAICEKMHELYPDYELVWQLRDQRDPFNVIPNYVRLAKPNKLSFYKELATSYCYITNECMEPNIIKREHQYFIQTWHADRGFKKILYEVWDEREENRPVDVIDNQVTDLCIAASESSVRKFKTAFHYNGEILCVGTPRNDQLVTETASKAALIKSKLQIKPFKKILLYAPTFRDDEKNKKQEIALDLNLIINTLEKRGEEWICLLRAHSVSKGLEASNLDNTHFMDVTDYPDMADLLLIADFLISDYSSCSCDFVLRNKPVILFIPDLDEYQAKSRTLKANPKDVGFLVAKSNAEVINIIEKTTLKQFEESCKKVLAYYKTNETGKSSEKICEIINEHCSVI